MEISELVTKSHTYAVRQGFWDSNRSPAETIALMHSELSELLEAFRIHDQDGIAEELADLMIRAGDAAGAWGVDLDAAILKKMAYNETRPRLHGKEF